ncbi:MAG TPA: sulfite exporter TauE/SafE family protein [Acetobacteraceae bacterium]|nr:sulfite exporter TauE/SafE family protein [Acetobacteraceae bacterium]
MMLIASTPPLLIAAGLAALAAGFVKGFAGFGFAVVFTPLFSLMSRDPRQVVFVALVLGAIMSLGVIAEARHAIAGDRAVPVILGTMAGTPLGIALLGVIDRPALKIAIAGFAIGITALRLARFRIRIGPGAGPLAAGAFLGGILNGCTSMGGPIPALIVAWQGREISDSRAILVMFNLLSYLLAITVGLGTGVARLAWLIPGIWLLPFAALGTFAGVHAVRRISQAAFTHVITAIVGLAGIAGLISVLAA